MSREDPSRVEKQGNRRDDLEVRRLSESRVLREDLGWPRGRHVLIERAGERKRKSERKR